jgi:hypothetical protein
VKQTNRSAHVLHRLHSPEGPANAQLHDDPERSKKDARQPTDSLRPSRMPRPPCDYGPETKVDEDEVSIDFRPNMHKRAKHLDRSFFMFKPERYRRSETPSFDYLNIESKLNQKIVQGREMPSTSWDAIEGAMIDEEEKVTDDNYLVLSPITSRGYRQHPGKSVREVSHWDSQDPDRTSDHAKKNRSFGMTIFQWRASRGGEHPTLNPVEENQSRPASKAKWASRLAKKLQAVGKRRWY